MAKQTFPVRMAARKSVGKQKALNTASETAADVKRQMKIQKALYEIAEAASAISDMQSFYRKLHEIVGKLMYAENFFIATYDEQSDLIAWPYYVDTVDVTPPPPTPLSKQRGATGWILRHGETLADADGSVAKVIESGEAEPVGTDSDGIGIPLKSDGKTIGVLIVQSYKSNIKYTLQDIKLLNFVAQHISTALTRAHAMEETRQRNVELQIINSVQEALASKLDMQEIYDLVGNEIRNIFNAQVVMISIYDHETETIEHRYAIERDKRIYAPGHHPIRGFRTQIVDTRKPVLVNTNVPEEAARLGQPTLPGTIPPKSWMGVPMMVGEKVLGILSLQNVEEENAFTEADLRLLETFASSMSVALENARLFDEAQHLLQETGQRNAELQIINSVQEGLASKLNITAIYELIGEKVREVFNVQVVDIVNYDPVANLISMPYSYEKGDRSVIAPTEPYGFRQQVINSRTHLLINHNFVELALQYDNPLLTGEWPKSALFVPLLIDDKVKSIISIQDLDRENAFSASDVQLLRTLSNAMSVALENAHLFEETQRLLQETEQRAQELATVNTVSAALAGELDLATLITLVGEQIRSVFKADIAFVALLDKKNNIINFPYQYGQQHIDPIQWGEGITSKIIQSGQPLMINRDMDRQRQQMGVTLIGKRARSFLGVPIFVGDESIGVVSVQHSEKEGIFTESDLRLLSTIAANVGIAFQNAHLFNETQRLFQAERQAHEQTETLRSVAQALNRSLSLTEVFNLVLTEIQKVIPYDSAGIYQVHENRRVFVTGRGFANLDDLIGVGFEFNQQDDEIGYLISQSLQPYILEDASVQYPQYFSAGPHAATQIRSYMAVPIVLNQNFIGMITLDREEPGFYKDQHTELAMAFAAQAATAINNARLYDETQRLLKETEQRATELQIINSVQDGLASRLDMQAIYELVGEKIRDTFNAQVVSIDTFNRTLRSMQSRYYFEGGRSLPGTTYAIFGFRKHVIENRKPIVINTDMSRWMKEYNNPVNVGMQPKSAIFVPMIVGNEAMGVISLQNNDQENAFSEADLRLLTTLASSMSVALENAQLWEQEKKYRKALERELEIAREIQAGFLPESLPQIAGWEIAASLMSAREVAGDFYDAFELPDGTLGIVIADVCDKGVGAALFMTLFRSLIRAAANLEYFEHTEQENATHPPEERLMRAISLTNNYIAETHGGSGMFATIFFGILDPHDGRLAYINAGHEPPLIIQSGKVCKSLRKTGPAAGAIQDSQFEALEIYLNPGDLFFALTDGALEAQNPYGEFFGRERLLDILQQDNKTSQGPVKTIEAELHQFMDGATQFDDITLLAVRRS